MFSQFLGSAAVQGRQSVPKSGGDRLQTLIHAMNHLKFSSINSYAIFLLLMPKFIYRSIERLKRYCAGYNRSYIEFD